ncbi:unnamed protein product [Diabrotica balteata]|uniref:BED-type domain-containing protein n=1 Tax=Diabrotica balteata TaxID=107213 RepID=A0A9N9SUQ9_DIABA|nr:unnamed protein product [Diabrotica balteata]
MSPKQSKLWRFFDKLDDNFAKCLLCGKKIKTSGNTTNLRCHLLSFTKAMSDITGKGNTHNTQKLESCYSTSSTSVSVNTESADNNSEKNGGNDDSAEKKSFKGQRTINETFRDAISYAEGGNRYTKISNSILYMICKDYQPFSIVEDKGFRQLFQTLAPQYKIPTRKTLTNLLENRYIAAAAHVKTKIENIDNYSLTADIWTDTLNSTSFFGVTLHFQEDIRISSLALNVWELSERHTSENISKTLQTICMDWGIVKEKLSVIVTDGAANMGKAIELCFGRTRHLHCFAHQINLIAEKAIEDTPNLGELIKKMKTVVTWFKQSIIAADELRAAQKSNTVQYSLKQSVPTRWNSVYYMIKRFLELREYVNIIINNHTTAPLMLTARELSDLSKIKSLLEPLEAVTTEISGEHFPTGSTIIPIVYHLIKKTEEINVDDSDLGTVFKEKLVQQIKKRLGSAEQVAVLAKATVLDPRFKKLYFSNPLNCAKAVEHILIDLKTINPTETETTINENLNTAQSNTSDKFNLWSNHQSIVEEHLASTSTVTTETESSSEISLYLRTPVVPLNTNPLEWWKNHKDMYSNLYKITKQYLCVIATSVPSERLFSKASQVLTERRNRLSGNKLQKILFLRSVDEKIFFSIN